MMSEIKSNFSSNRVYLGMGSNIPPRETYLIKAIEILKERFPDEFKFSPIYATKPYQGKEQDCYFNCCVSFKSSLSPEKMLNTVLTIEKELGRVRRGIKWDSRTIDIDILLFGDCLIDQKDLIIPHYDLSSRDFFLIPLLDLNEQLVNPRTGLSLKTELENLPEELLTHPEIQEVDFNLS